MHPVLRVGRNVPFSGSETNTKKKRHASEPTQFVGELVELLRISGIKIRVNWI